MKVLKRFFCKILVLVVFVSCIDLPTKPGGPYNPFDPNSPNYKEPTVTIISGPDENATITQDMVSFQWQGNHEAVQYRYAIDNGPWTEYSDGNSKMFSGLDEYIHQFHLQGRYPTLAEGAVVTRSFTVNAIQGPALYIYPKRKTISSGDQFQMELWLDDTNNIAGLSTQMIFAPSKLRIDAVDFMEGGNESLMLQNGGQLIAFQETDNITGTLQIDCAVVQGNPHDISGSGAFVRITFKHLSGTNAALTLSSSSMLENSDGQSVVINTLVGSQIEVE